MKASVATRWLRPLRHTWTRLLLNLHRAPVPGIAEFYPSDFIVLAGASCTLHWRVTDAWRLTLGPVAGPGGQPIELDVTGRHRLELDIPADPRYHTVFLHADGAGGQRASQRLNLRPQPVNPRSPAFARVRAVPLLPAFGDGSWRLRRTSDLAPDPRRPIALAEPRRYPFSAPTPGSAPAPDAARHITRLNHLLAPLADWLARRRAGGHAGCRTGCAAAAVASASFSLLLSRMISAPP